ncbi:SAC3/GANP/Nin1/mts3/eIF-3 p25 family-domain-containing protein [Sphaerosporella brunnea]|uniref:SAC3/GANP/Nin1/mts3/eIF-3 p25 family-domain-containing protein n=1 Tax=Sphaerosporella brunnea TaxID=1250544 RepID=A0A5J5F5D0_9PEZI|nr:SAC3/GANP/Nin1/mts3/eIF-3 p25 family-domain-containing protein [Sphaerosporella brunnea]
MEEKDCSSYYSREEIFKVGTIEEWYKAFIESRALERQELIAAGVIDNPAVQKPLEEAKPFRGTCIYMCPSFESVQRIHQKMVDKFEMTDGKPDHKKFVKSFHRPAAGLEAPLPCDVRKPWILVGTLHYLVKEILGRYPWQECQGFVRDRTRSIRQDFTYQNYEGDEAVHCTEVIIRFHLVGLYLLPDNDEYMELEQLGKSLTTLSFLYKASQVPDADGNYKRFPNEAEFRSYMILTHIHDGYVEREDFMKWPEEVRNSEQVKHAIRIYQAAQKCLRGSAEGFNAMHYANTFFTLVASEKTDFTTACLLEVYFADIRKSALQAIASNYMKTSKMTTLDFIQDLLYYEEIEDLIDEIENYGLEVGQNTIDGVSYTYLVLGGKKFNSKFEACFLV